MKREKEKIKRKTILIEKKNFFLYLNTLHYIQTFKLVR